MIGRVKRQLVAFATSRAQVELAATLAASSPSDRKLAKAAAAAIETLRGMPLPQPLIGDAIDRWLPVRLVDVLRAAGIRTLADLTLRVPRRRRCGQASLVSGRPAPATSRRSLPSILRSPNALAR